MQVFYIYKMDFGTLEDLVHRKPREHHADWGKRLRCNQKQLAIFAFVDRHGELDCILCKKKNNNFAEM